MHIFWIFVFLLKEKSHQISFNPVRTKDSLTPRSFCFLDRKRLKLSLLIYSYPLKDTLDFETFWLQKSGEGNRVLCVAPSLTCPQCKHSHRLSVRSGPERHTDASACLTLHLGLSFLLVSSDCKGIGTLENVRLYWGLLEWIGRFIFPKDRVHWVGHLPSWFWTSILKWTKRFQIWLPVN